MKNTELWNTYENIRKIKRQEKKKEEEEEEEEEEENLLRKKRYKTCLKGLKFQLETAETAFTGEPAASSRGRWDKLIYL